MPVPYIAEIEFPSDPEAGAAKQSELAKSVRLGQEWRYVAGVGVAYSKDYKRAYAGAVVVSTSNWKVISDSKVDGEISWNAEDDFQCWREGDLVGRAIHKLSTPPDVIMVEGHGIAHPRRFGLASLIGMMFEIPTIGVATKFPTGCHLPKTEMGDPRRGQKRSLVVNPGNHVVGAELITQDRQEALCVSPGHRVSIQEAVTMTLKASPWHRIPEPLRAAKEKAEAFRDEREGV
jgi:deoxyribonuclease V